jgi:hypothetical protein
MGVLWLSTAPLTSGLVALMFGTRYLSMLFGLVFFGHQIGSFLGAWSGGYVFVQSGNYDLMWWISVLLGLAAAVIHMPIVEKLAPQFMERPNTAAWEMWNEHAFAVKLAGIVLAAWLAAFAFILAETRLPPGATGRMVVLFSPTMSAADAVRRIAKAEGKIVGSIGSTSFLRAISDDKPALSARIQGQGGIATYRNLPAAPDFVGCMTLLSSKVSGAGGILK